MQSDLTALCKDARDRIAVPAVPLAAIRQAAQSGPAPSREKGRKRFTVALLAGLAIAGAAAAAEIWSDTHVTVSPHGNVDLRAPSMKFAKHPTDADARAAAAQAQFPVVLPSGLPDGAWLYQLFYNPSTIVFQYSLPGAWRRSDHLLWIVLADPRSVGAPNASDGANGTRALPAGEGELMFGGEKNRPLVRVTSQRWIIGHETVIVPPSTLTPDELANLKRAMLARSKP